ncbi:hypothetical protein Tco_1270790, partial [Tanacetum coccineum]
VPADSSSSIPADYVSAGHVLVPADRDRICCLLFIDISTRNSPKRLGKTAKEIQCSSSCFSDEHVAVQQEIRYMDGQFKARLVAMKESKKMKKTMLQTQFAEYSVTEEKPTQGFMTFSEDSSECESSDCPTLYLFLLELPALAQSLLILISSVLFHQFLKTSGRSDNLEMEEMDLKCQGWGNASVPPPITGTIIPAQTQSDIEETRDKSSDSETHASCDSSLKTKTKDFPPAVDIQTLPESDVEDPNSTTGSPSFSCSENVKSPRIICNKSGMNNRNVCKNNFVRVKKCFVCGSKLHLIKDCDFYNCVDSVPCKSKAASVPAGSRNSPASVTAGGSDPAASRNRPAVNSADRPHPAGWSKRPATVSAGRPVSAGWLNPAARPYFRPSSVYFNNMYLPDLYDPWLKQIYTRI